MSSASGPGRLIAIGDIHGCVHALDALLEAIDPTPDDELVFLGDLIDQGRDSRDVLDRLIELKGRCRVMLIKGNHEEMLAAAGESEQALRYWEHCGGAATLSSYRFGGKLPDIPDEHRALLEECLSYYETESAIFTHANYQPDADMPSQPQYQLRWALFDPETMQPHCSGKPVYVGHTEQTDGDVLDLGFATCIDTACWRYGWLTAIEVPSKQVWQASRWGMLRAPGEATQGSRVSKLISDGAEAGASH